MLWPSTLLVPKIETSAKSAVTPNRWPNKVDLGAIKNETKMKLDRVQVRCGASRLGVRTESKPDLKSANRATHTPGGADHARFHTSFHPNVVLDAAAARRHCE